MENNSVILSIGGHVGDAELTTGGVLASCAAKGGKIITLALTGGEKGAPPNMSVSEYRKQKENEAHEFANMLRGTAYVLPYLDGELPDNDEVRLTVCDIIRKEKPTLIFTHHSKSMHKDHEMCNKIVNDAWFYASLSTYERELPAHFAPLYFAENWEDSTDFKPYAYFEVTKEGFELWQKAIVKHWFVTGSKSFPYMEYYEHLKRLRGIENRTDFAEAFMPRPETLKVKIKY